MTMAMTTTKDQLDLAFDEADEAKANLEKRQEKLQVAQQQADEASGLTEAAQRQQENVQAKLRVLELAEADHNALQAKHAELDTELATAKKERDQAQVAHEASAAIAAAIRDMNNWTRAAEKVGGLFGKSATNIKNIRAPNDVKPSLATEADKLEGQEASLREQVGTLQKPQDDLTKADETLKRLALTSQRRIAQRRTVEHLERQLEAVKEEEEDQTGVKPDDVKRAQSDYIAAKRAVLEAPEVERSTQVKLQAAHAELAEAEDRYNIAQAGRDEAEQLYIEDIDLAGPGADGFLIATARLRQKIPADYSLRWTVDGVPAGADSEGKVRMNTNGLALGDYVFDVHLERALKAAVITQAEGS
jgi:hypothetical protein